MSRRTQRVESVIREAIGMLLLTKISDPRIDPARTSVTRVEVPADLLTARVYVSVMGTEAEQRNALRALRHAAGHIQELMARQVQLRTTPRLDFQPDVQFKKVIQTQAILQQVGEELRHQDELRGAATPSADEEPPPEEGCA
jgi:ribosome-binding factor A